MRRAVALLARLEHHALEEERRALVTARGELEARARELAGLDRRFAAEHAAAFTLAGGPQPLAPYATAVQARRRGLAAELARAEAEVAAGTERLREQARRWKALDLAEAGLRERAEQAARRGEVARIEEAAGIAAAGRIRTRGPA